MFELKAETWDEIWPEVKPLLQAHREETAPDERRPFQVQEVQARALSVAGVLRIWTARLDGRLIGYSTWYVSPGLDSPTVTATQGPWYCLPAWRSRWGLRLFQESLRGLRALGVCVCYPHHWMHGAGPRLGEYFRRLGAVPLETSYELWLEESA